MLTGNDSECCRRNKLHVHSRITLWVKLHIAVGGFGDEGDHEILLEVHQGTLVFLDNRSRSHRNTTLTSISGHRSNHSLRVKSACCHQKHTLKLFGSCQVSSISIAELEREQNLIGIAVCQDCFTWLDFKLSTTG